MAFASLCAYTFLSTARLATSIAVCLEVGSVHSAISGSSSCARRLRNTKSPSFSIEPSMLTSSPRRSVKKPASARGFSHGTET
jgi:hypothetical protein